jgi:hypothetical protein
MNSAEVARPIIKKAVAKAHYLRVAAEWMTGRKRVPSVALADAESAARAVLARHACQPKDNIKLPSPGHGNKQSVKS